MRGKRGILGGFKFLWAVLKKFDRDHGFFLSAGITFNLLICLIPFSLLMLGFVGTYLYSSREVLQQIHRFFESSVPSLDPKIMRSILRIIRDRKIAGVLGMGGLIWASTWVFSSLRIALNIVFQVKKGWSFIRGKAVDLSMILLVGLLLILSITFTSGATFIQRFHFAFFPEIGIGLQFVLKYLLPFIFTYWMAFLIYKIVPNRKIHYQAALQAALFTSLLWEVAKQLFGWYVLRLGRFSMIYGSLSTLVIFILWVYYSSVILILGGEVAFFIGKGRRK